MSYLDLHAGIVERIRQCPEHCWHKTESPPLRPSKDGHVWQTCCRCPKQRSVHRDHADDWKMGDADDGE